MPNIRAHAGVAIWENFHLPVDELSGAFVHNYPNSVSYLKDKVSTVTLDPSSISTRLVFNASSSNNIYGNSTTVTPESIHARTCIRYI